jgi:hypothetical protein
VRRLARDGPCGVGGRDTWITGERSKAPGRTSVPTKSFSSSFLSIFTEAVRCALWAVLRAGWVKLATSSVGGKEGWRGACSLHYSEGYMQVRRGASEKILLCK